MVKKSILLTIVCLCVCSAATARKYDIPDYEYIQSIGKTQYAILLHRFLEQDTTLSVTDVKTIYYGSAFYGYLGNGMDRYDYEVAKKRGMKGFTAFLDSCLSVTPVDLQTITCRYAAAEMAKDTVSMHKYWEMYNQLTYAIILTGDGRTDTTAVHVVSIADEYSLLYYIWNATLEKQSLTFTQCDKMDCITKYGQKKTIFFDVQLVCALERYNKNKDTEPFYFWYNPDIHKQIPQIPNPKYKKVSLPSQNRQE